MGKILFLLSIFGINVHKMKVSFQESSYFIRTYFLFKKSATKEFPISLYPILGDRTDNGGTASGHYFHQDLFVAQNIYNINPINHVDIGSRVDGFVAHVASFRKIEIFDIRHIDINVSNIDFRQIDLNKEIPEKYQNYTNSLSCLHTIEHIGLGRYGDDIDFDGHIKAFENLSKIVKPGGVFYFSTVFGPQRIEFNAHRVFSIQYLVNMIQSNFEIDSFSYVDDKGDFYKLVDLDPTSNYNCNYGCAIFVLRKK